jgi:hypothetical protein
MKMCMLKSRRLLVNVKSILHLYPGMKQINLNCSPTVSVDFTKEGKHFLSIKVHTLILHFLHKIKIVYVVFTQ